MIESLILAEMAGKKLGSELEMLRKLQHAARLHDHVRCRIMECKQTKKLNHAKKRLN